MYKEQTELIQDQLDTELYTARTKLEEVLDELAFAVITRCWPPNCMKWYTNVIPTEWLL